MKIFRFALLLVALPFLGGCLSFSAVNSAKYPSARVVPDQIHVEKAAISKNNELLIFLKGSITNSPRDSRFTLAIPLAEIESRYNVYPLPYTNGTFRANMDVQRNAIHEGWSEQTITNNIEIVPIGRAISPPYVFPDGYAPVTIGELAKPLAN